MKKIIIVFTAILFIGCTQRLFDFTIVSTKNIDLAQLSSTEKGKNRVEGEDKSDIVVFIPTRTIAIDQAIDNTIEGIPGCIALLDGVVYSKSWWVPFIYGEQRFIIEATPLIDSSVVGTTPISKYNKVHLDTNGKFKSIEAISYIDFKLEKSKMTEKR